MHDIALDDITQLKLSTPPLREQNAAWCSIDRSTQGGKDQDSCGISERGVRQRTWPGAAKTRLEPKQGAWSTFLEFSLDVLLSAETLKGLRREKTS